MIFPKKYKTLLSVDDLRLENFSIVPIRYKDKFDIMKWRNEQIYHLRQTKKLNKKNQEEYFKNIVNPLFYSNCPDQILFSFLKNDKCIGYGGLVKINWNDRNAEISFLIDTVLESKYFKKYWKIFLQLIEIVAYEELGLHKIFTYAYNLRPKLYEALTESGYTEDACIKEHFLQENQSFGDVIMHYKLSDYRYMPLSLNDEKITLKWANDKLTRLNSFSSNEITTKEHRKWLIKKIKSSDSDYYICLFKNKKVGIIKFDKINNDFIIGITIDENFRGLKLSSKFFKILCKKKLRENSNCSIIAKIKSNNKISIKSFERVGFKFWKSDFIKSQEILIYKLK